MRALVTGVAGFIGSHLAEALVVDGWRVRGIDCFTDYYEVTQKKSNLDTLIAGTQFEFLEADLGRVDIAPLLSGVDAVFHHAGQPGVRLSWSDGFDTYTTQNITVTQRLLEACRLEPVRRFVYASSSSVYGNAPSFPTSESTLPRPHSPYGVTKLAGEHLCSLYAANWGIPTIALRYFTVYGPRQRPDMAFHRFIEATLRGDSVPLFGTGEQVRDFTYVADVVAANIAAAVADVPRGTVLNVAGGGCVTVNEILGLIGATLGCELHIQHLPAQAGDVMATGGAIDAAAKSLSWQPHTALIEGLARQIAWHRSRASTIDVITVQSGARSSGR